VRLFDRAGARRASGPRLQRSGISSFWLYLIAEFLIGIYGLAFNGLLHIIQVPYTWIIVEFSPSLAALSLLQFIFCGLLIALPTILMGTTLPLLAHYLFTQKNELSVKVPSLYGVNTLGACVGSFLAGFIILPALGYKSSIILAAWINFLLVTLAVIVVGDAERPKISHITKGFRSIFSFDNKKADQFPQASLSPKDWSVCIALFGSGAISMLTQILWNRLAGLSYGASVYIFPLVTTIVLLGIVLGSFIFRKFSSNPQTSLNVLICIPIISGAIFYFGTFIFTRSPIMVLFWHQRIVPGFRLYTLLQFAWISICLLPAATAIGMIFPAATTVITREKQFASKTLGVGYALNIAGLITGAVVGAFYVLPYLGLETIGKIIFLLLVVITIILSWNFQRQILFIACMLLLASSLTFIIPSYDWNLLTAGHFYNRRAVKNNEKLRTQGYFNIQNYAKWNTSMLLAHRDDPYATISIHEKANTKGTRHFSINGKVDGNNKSDLKTTRMLALLPFIFRPDAQNALVIGLGTGSTLVEALRYPDMKRATLVELSVAMIDFSRTYFNDINKNIWKDHRIKIENRDGREFLRHTKEKFDLILSEPSNPWLDGLGSLFTKEFFELVLKRLTYKGVAALWFHSYGLDCRSATSVFAAAAQVFPSLLIFKNGGDYYLIAKNEAKEMRIAPIPTDAMHLEKDLFSLVKVKEKEDVKSYESFFKKTLIADKDSILRFVNVANTDDNQLLQYLTGKMFWQKVYCNDLSDVIDLKSIHNKYPK